MLDRHILCEYNIHVLNIYKNGGEAKMRRLFLTCASALLLLPICGHMQVFSIFPPKTVCVTISSGADGQLFPSAEGFSKLSTIQAFLLEGDRGDMGSTVVETEAEAAALAIPSERNRKELIFFLSIVGVLLLWAVFVCGSLIRSEKWIEDQMRAQDPSERGDGQK